MKKFLGAMHFGELYYVFGRTTGEDTAFATDADYRFFLKKYSELVHPMCSTLAYCLLPDQYHFVIRMGEEDKLADKIPFNQDRCYISKQFGRLINKYTLSINKRRNRRGNIFIRPFRRDHIADDILLAEYIRAVHLLPVESGFCSHPGSWIYSSYFPLMNSRPSLVEWQQLEMLFANKELFEEYHMQDQSMRFALPAFYQKAAA